MSDDILNHPAAVQAECQQCDWASPRLAVDYSSPNGLWRARMSVTIQHREHAAEKHPPLMPRINHLLTEVSQ